MLELNKKITCTFHLSTNNGEVLDKNSLGINLIINNNKPITVERHITDKHFITEYCSTKSEKNTAKKFIEDFPDFEQYAVIKNKNFNIFIGFNLLTGSVMRIGEKIVKRTKYHTLVSVGVGGNDNSAIMHYYEGFESMKDISESIKNIFIESENLKNIEEKNVDAIDNTISVTEKVINNLHVLKENNNDAIKTIKLLEEKIDILEEKLSRSSIESTQPAKSQLVNCIKNVVEEEKLSKNDFIKFIDLIKDKAIEALFETKTSDEDEAPVEPPEASEVKDDVSIIEQGKTPLDAPDETETVDVQDIKVLKVGDIFKNGKIIAYFMSARSIDNFEEFCSMSMAPSFSHFVSINKFIIDDGEKQKLFDIQNNITTLI